MVEHLHHRAREAIGVAQAAFGRRGGRRLCRCAGPHGAVQSLHRIPQKGAVRLEQRGIDRNRRIRQLERHGCNHKVDTAAVQLLRIEFAHRAAAVHLEGREFALDTRSQKSTRAHTQRARNHHAGGLPQCAVLLEHRAKVHGKICRFAVRNVRQRHFPLDRVACGACCRPQLRIFTLNRVQLRIIHVNLLTHAQQHRPQMCKQVVSQRCIAREIHAHRAFYLADQPSGQMAQVHLAGSPFFAIVTGDIRCQILL